MAEEIIEQGYRELADTILEHNPGVDLGRVRAAFELADRAHSGQKRKAGTPYVTHCVAAAQICAEMGLDEDSIVAALLHDCIEDTAITHEDIARQFGAACSLRAARTSRWKTSAKCSWRWRRTSVSSSSRSPTGCTICARWNTWSRRSSSKSRSKRWRSMRPSPTGLACRR